MKKQILIIVALSMMIFMIAGVFAFDFSVTGSEIIKDDRTIFKAKTNLWHDDGRTPTYVKYSYNKGYWTKGIPASGQGNVMLSLSEDYFKGTVNVHLTETNSYFVGNKAYITCSGRAVIWYKGIIPMIKNYDNIQYVYDKDLKIVSLDFLKIPVK